MDLLKSVCFQLKERFPELGELLEDLEGIIPTIVVVGAQSAGKSSLLNRLLPDFVTTREGVSLFSLPTSAGTCTKFPITLSFINTPAPFMKLTGVRRDGVALFPDFAVPEAGKEMQQTDLVDVRRRITDHNISAAMFDSEMFLSIGAPGLDSYALVDLPGLTLADPVLGPIIDSGVRERVREADIVVVCKQINADIMDCQAVNIVRDERKKGAKVIVVSTYADTSVAVEHIPVESAKVAQHGWRLALSTTQSPPVEEEAFLRAKHSSLSSLPGVLVGSQELRKEIRGAYQAMLTQQMPTIRTRVSSLLKQVQHCLAEIGEAPRTLSESKRALNKAAQNIGRPVQGELSPVDTMLDDCIVLFEGSVPPEFIQTKLHDELFMERVMRDGCRSKGVRGTEGLFDYLSSAYKALAQMLVPDIETSLEQSIRDWPV